MARKPSKSKEKAEKALHEMTAKVIEAIEDNPGDWTKPWRSALVAGGLPTNASTKKRYSGGNLFWLTLIAQSNGWSNVWGTYKQWQALGCQVRKGSTGTLGMFYKPFRITEERNGEEVEKVIPLLRTFTVFSASQVEGGLELVEERFGKVELTEHDPIEHAEEFFTAIGADLRHGGDRAFYRHAVQVGDGDFIQVPHLEQFAKPEGYYSTLAHEHVHWTGAEHRMNRNKGKHFGDEVYAREELVAELGAAFVMGYLGIDTLAEGCDHTAYLGSWLKTLREEPKALWSVMGDAAKALDFLVHEAGENGETLHTEEEAA